MKNRLFSAAAAAAFALGAAGAASAQSIDYSSMQQLFNEPVTTSATGSPLRATEVPVDMTIITADDIKRSGATDLPTILSRVPGIDILNFGAADADISVRGYDQAYSPRLLVLINGREVYLDDYGYTAWANLPVELSEIRQIEVVRGPNSALFGFNAVGGVINIITYNPKYDKADALEVHGGTQSDVGVSVVQTLHLGNRISVRLSGGEENQNEWAHTNSAPNPWATHFMGDMVAQLSPKTEFRLEGSWSHSREEDMLPTLSYVTATYATDSIKGTLTSETAWGELQAQAYANNLEYIAPTGVGVIDFKNRVVVADVQDLLKIGTRSTVRVALEYRNNTINTQTIDTGAIAYTVWAPSAMWNFAATSKLSITGAVRLDALQLGREGPLPAGFPTTPQSAWNRSLQSFSANLGAVYKPTDLDTLRATYARGIQVPSLVQLGAIQGLQGPVPYGAAIGGNPDLMPAVVTNYELTYDRAFPTIGAKASVKVFYQQTEDVMGLWDFTHPDVGPTPTSSTELLFKNVSNSDMAGFELSASGKLKNGFRWNADTTYTAVTDKAFPGYNLVTRVADFAQSTPKFRGNLGAGWSGGHWSIDGYLHYVTDYTAFNGSALVYTPGYATLAGRVAYQMPWGVTAAVSGQNLTTDHQNQSLATAEKAERKVLLSLSKSW